MDKEKRNRIYARLEKALMEEPCTYEEARNAVCMLTSVYFQRKSGNFLKNVSLEEIAGYGED